MLMIEKDIKNALALMNDLISATVLSDTFNNSLEDL